MEPNFTHLGTWCHARQCRIICTITGCYTDYMGAVGTFVNKWQTRIITWMTNSCHSSKWNSWWFGGSTATKWFFVYLIPGWIGIWKRWFLRRGENRSTRWKTSVSKGENQQQTQTKYARCRDLNQATLVGGEHSQHCTIPCSPDLPCSNYFSLVCLSVFFTSLFLYW